jgi:crotonobetainyl-CoA:carnitine CoA-transferase CaiB-like acyl-CoA transferase
MWLGDLGAEVIKIETPGVGDPRRRFPPMLKNEQGEQISGGFLVYNRNKKSVTLDLKSEAGVRVYKDLVAKSDIVVENLKPGTVDRLGVGYDVLKQVNPRLIYAALSGFGRMEGLKGPYSDRPAFDAVVQAMGGVMHRIGEADGPPMLAVPGTADRLSAMVAGYTIMVALFMRERTGEGQFVDAAMYDSTLMLNEAGISAFSMTGKVLTRGKDELYAPVGGFKTSDGWVGLIIPGEDMWVRFCNAISRPDLAEHPLCKGSQNRASNYKTFLKPIVDEWMARHTREEVVQILMKHGVPAGVVQTSADLFECPQVAARHMLVEVKDPVAGTVKLANNPFRISGAAEKEPAAPPRLGEHNDAILSNVLGYSAAEIERLKQSAVI